MSRLMYMYPKGALKSPPLVAVILRLTRVDARKNSIFPLCLARVKSLHHHPNPALVSVTGQFHSAPSARRFSSEKLSLSTIDSTLLYENNNARPGYFILISVMSAVQLVFWAYLSYFALTQFGDGKGIRHASDQQTKTGHEKVDTDGVSAVDASEGSRAVDKPEQNLWFASLKWRLGLSVLALGAGVFFAVTACMYPLRIIHKLRFLRSAGAVQIHTYSPFGSVRVLETPLTSVTCSGDRLTGKSQMSLKLKGYSMYFLIDKQGTFPAPHQFDRLIASRRRLL